VHSNVKSTWNKNNIQLLTGKKSYRCKNCAQAFSLTRTLWFLTLESEATANKKYPTANSDANR
jgi:hypothetical protein